MQIDSKIGLNVGYRVVHVQNARFFKNRIAKFLQFMQLTVVIVVFTDNCRSYLSQVQIVAKRVNSKVNRKVNTSLFGTNITSASKFR